MRPPTLLFKALLIVPSCLAISASGQGAPSPMLSLRPSVQVDSQGIKLSDLVEELPKGMADVKLAAAPRLGTRISLPRDQVARLVHKAVPELSATNWTGALGIHITRRMRPLEELEVKQLLTERLQEEYVKDRGELDLRFTRPWTPVQVPDEPLRLVIVDLPTAGVTPSCIIRFEMRTDKESAGSWQVSVQARVWREVWVAGSPIRYGQLASEADLMLERRDILKLRDAWGEGDVDLSNPYLEICESLKAGTPLRSRSFRLRPIVRRGQIVEAVVKAGALLVSVKAETLEDGLPGQIVRVRNLSSRREFRGKVKDENTIEISL